VDVLDFPGPAEWESWLAAHHDLRPEAWLRIAKRQSGIATITIAEALAVALCYGWIDGQRRSLDDVSYLQRYSRRRPTSSWSRVNVATVEALTAASRMRPAGLAEVAAAKADGRWAAAYEPQRMARYRPISRLRSPATRPRTPPSSASASLFYADLTVDFADDRFLNERTSRVWIHGDLHAENSAGLGRLGQVHPVQHGVVQRELPLQRR
jgi:hypothetical protein